MRTRMRLKKHHKPMMDKRRMLEDRGHRTRDCKDWTLYFRPVKYDNGERNATGTIVSEAKTVLY